MRDVSAFPDLANVKCCPTSSAVPLKIGELCDVRTFGKRPSVANVIPAFQTAECLAQCFVDAGNINMFTKFNICPHATLRFASA